MSFPPRLSFTLTNACNLRCRMCGQWSETGYIRTAVRKQAGMQLSDWKRLVDEAVAHNANWILLRGGETFTFPGIMDLLWYLNDRQIAMSIDTNGTLLKDVAAELVKLSNVHITVSVDGPEEIHDAVRGVKGTFRRMEEGLAALREQEAASGRTVSRTICFTISPYSYKGLGAMPEVARRLGMRQIHIVPYYYFPESVGKKYEEELAAIGSGAFSWRGFHHEESGIDFDEFLRQLHQYQEGLGPDSKFQFMDLNEDQYRVWFRDAVTPVGPTECWNTTGLLDIQPDGEANFCIDFPDYSIGNVKDATIEELWNGERAARFREFRKKQALAVCHRCGAKYCSAEDATEGASAQ